MTLVARCSESSAWCSACGGGCARAAATGDAGDVGDVGDVGSDPRMLPDAVSMLDNAH